MFGFKLNIILKKHSYSCLDTGCLTVTVIEIMANNHSPTVIICSYFEHWQLYSGLLFALITNTTHNLWEWFLMNSTSRLSSNISLLTSGLEITDGYHCGGVIFQNHSSTVMAGKLFPNPVTSSINKALIPMTIRMLTISIWNVWCVKW